MPHAHQTALTGRERVQRTFARASLDRIARYDTFWSETITRWASEGLTGGTAAVLDLLEADLHQIGWYWPSPFPGRREVISQDEQTIVFTDQFGQTVREWKDRTGTPEHIGWECDSRDIWNTRLKPALQRSGPQVDLDAAADRHAKGRQRDRWCYVAGIEPFESMRKMIGDETTLIAMATEPQWIVDMAQVIVDSSLRTYQALLGAGIQPDGLWTYGDMAFNHSTICSPAMYRELVWPQHRRLVEFAHRHGMKFIYHTDGNVNGVIDLYLEAGFDCLQPLEAKAGMDLRTLGPAYGDRLTFFGNIDIMKLATNDLDLIEEEIAAKLAAGKATGSYIYHCDHSIPPQVSWSTYRHIIELIDRHGRYDRPAAGPG